MAGVDRRLRRQRRFRLAALALGLGGIGAGVMALSGVGWGAALALLAGGIAAALVLHHPGGVPILVYHSVSPDASWLPWAQNTSVRPEVFRRHLSVLRHGGWQVIPTASLIAARAAGESLPRRSVILHFDDGYLDNLLFAAPLLREFDMPAMFFISCDFVAGTEQRRPDGPQPWAGYMTAPEMRGMDADPLFEIEAHGCDHGRIPVSDRIVDRITDRNWRRHTPLHWAVTPGDKADWFLRDKPPPQLAIGSPVPESDSVLSGRWWHDAGPETEAAFQARIRTAMQESQARFAALIGRTPRVFAWPFDRSCETGIAEAWRCGYEAVTGGRGDNRVGEDPFRLSRVHVQDRAFGGGPIWLEGLWLRARVSSASGRLGWHLLLALAARMRRRRLGPSGYGGAG
ncbi:Polysaccharide deacetylase [Paracoccus isoporae]|uniref:Chitooligosaccharide deacetylase n=1 Tax=Paracoccus isoporae TaxID=591205 RepID=A0A1G6XF83_9RHOB|nr:polysaccharide deacetylase family protein [Paracoccus isoporae]SDD76859.1 Polysaccharide deacetylase [Paracoccus isoporae]